MATKVKFKPNKSVKKRFRVTATGKLKHNHSLTSHLRSARNAKTKRKLRRASVLADGHSKNMRAMMGISGNSPGRVAHKINTRQPISLRAA